MIVCTVGRLTDSLSALNGVRSDKPVVSKFSGFADPLGTKTCGSPGATTASRVAQETKSFFSLVFISKCQCTGEKRKMTRSSQTDTD